MDIHTTLQELDNLIKKGKAHGQFNPPADPNMITHVERAFDITLPDSYKAFLERYNGGLIWSPKLDHLAISGDMETVKWNSFTLFSLAELVSHYEDCRDKSWKIYDFKGPYPYIPFASTSINELIVFVNVAWGQPGSPVFDAFHEEPASDWGILATSFTEFLGQYVQSKGEPETIGNERDQHAEELRWTPSAIELKGLEKPKAVIRRATSYLSLYPNDYYSYVLRGEALLESGRDEEARSDLEQAIALNPGFSYGRYTRSKLFIKEEQFEEALQDLTIAIEHASDDPFYLAARANLLLSMGNLQEALPDCNRAIELDNRNLLALMSREDIYGRLGEQNKATADREVINDILSE